MQELAPSVKTALAIFDQVGDARPRCAAHRDGLAGECRLRRGGEHSVLLVPHVHEFDPAVAPQRVDGRIQRVTDDAVAPPHARVRQHLPHPVGHCPHGPAPFKGLFGLACSY